MHLISADKATLTPSIPQTTLSGVPAIIMVSGKSDGKGRRRCSRHKSAVNNRLSYHHQRVIEIRSICSILPLLLFVERKSPQKSLRRINSLWKCFPRLGNLGSCHRSSLISPSMIHVSDHISDFLIIEKKLRRHCGVISLTIHFNWPSHPSQNNCDRTI